MKDYKPDTNQSIIYIVRSTLEKSEIYIGKTNRQFSKRKQEHLDEARKGDGTKFHNALINTGFANWEWEILEICERAKEFDNVKKHELSKVLEFIRTYSDKANLEMIHYHCKSGNGRVCENKKSCQRDLLNEYALGFVKEKVSNPTSLKIILRKKYWKVSSNE